MKPLHFSIEVQAQDSYLYGGYIFFAMQDGNIVYLPMADVMHALFEKYPEYSSILKLAFSRNDYFSSAAGRLFMGIPMVNHAMKRAWIDAAENTNFELRWYEVADHVKKIGTLNSPVLDMRLYAMNLYVGCKDGLYESKLNLQDDYHILPQEPNRRFDAKTIALNSGYGSIIISAGKEGLFNAPLSDETNSISVSDKANSSISYRTGWSTSNLLNYEDSINFEYLLNEMEKTNKRVGYSKFDSRGDNERIKILGIKKIKSSDMVENLSIEKDDILYVFNSSQSSFIYSKDGIYVINLLSKDKGEYHLSSRTTKDSIYLGKRKKVEKPVSATVVPAGCIIEFMNNVKLFQGGDIVTLENEPTFRVRSFMNSIRYRYLVASTKLKEVTIHSLEPFDTYESPLNRNAIRARYNHKPVGSYSNSSETVDDLPF